VSDGQTELARRKRFIDKVRAAQPPATRRPQVPHFPLTDVRSAKERFEAALAIMGGQSVTLEKPLDLPTWIERRFGADAIVCSAVPEVSGNRMLENTTSPASLADVDVGVVRARFGVAETGSLWFSEAEYRVNALGYLSQHLIVLLDDESLLDGLQDMYRKADFHTARYAALVTGPSATADIEGVMIRGAQGVRSLTVVWRK
jgi:L-lactate dehydrogenase complex protein LldG